MLVDEAHRSHASQMHAHLLAALPNCACIGFTGTPIIMGPRSGRTTSLASSWTATRSKNPRRTAQRCRSCTKDAAPMGPWRKGAIWISFSIAGSKTVRRRARGHSQKVRDQGRGAGQTEELIAAKADDMMRHYVEHILPNHLKAQVVAYSRLAAIRYQAALVARDKLVKGRGAGRCAAGT